MMNTSDTDPTIQVQPEAATQKIEAWAEPPPDRPAPQPMPWWSALSLLVLAALVALLAWAAITVASWPDPSSELPTAVFLTTTPAATQARPATPETTPAVPQFKSGDTVQVSNTGGLGVRLRSGPGVLYETLKIVAEGSNLEIMGEPRQADQHLWWPVRDPSDGLSGWIVSDYVVKP